MTLMHPAHGPLPLMYTQSLLRESQPNNTHETPGDVEEEIRLPKALIENGAAILERLLQVQSAGWQDESIDRYFDNQRQVADNASDALSHQWFLRMKRQLEEIDKGLKCIPRERVRFLDLGCCPGGFSSYILGKNFSSTGCGISLPVGEGGHSFDLEDYLQTRYNLFFANMTRYQLGPTRIDNPQYYELPETVAPGTLDIVLIDGHQLRVQTSTLPWDKDKLLISQVIIALQSVKEGGTIIMKLPMPHRFTSAKMAVIFKILSQDVQGWKPYTMHANRGTFYLVARGFGRGEQYYRAPNILQQFRQLWMDLTFGGDEKLGRFLKSDDFHFAVTSDEIINNHIHWLVKFGKPLWTVQESRLRQMYQRKGIF